MGFPWSNRYPCFQHPVHNRFNILEYFRIRFRTAMFLILYIGHHCFISLEIAGYWIVSTTPPSWLLNDRLVHLMEFLIQKELIRTLIHETLYFLTFCLSSNILVKLGRRCSRLPWPFLLLFKIWGQYLIDWTKCMIFNIYQRFRITQDFLASYISWDRVVLEKLIDWCWSGDQ